MVENVLMIVVDALRRDRIGAYESSLRTSTLDALARDGAVFENAYACSNVTDVAVTTILSGKYPLAHGVLNHGTNVTDQERRFGHGTQSLAEQLVAADYRTCSIEPVLDRWHRDGFETFESGGEPTESQTGSPTGSSALRTAASKFLDRLPGRLSGRIRSRFGGRDFGLDAGEITDACIEYVADSDRPFFLFAHYWDVHTPYDPPKEYVRDVRSRRSYDDTSVDALIDREGLSGTLTADALRTSKLSGSYPESVGEIAAHYEASVEYVDDQLGRLFDALADSDRLDDTLVVVTADHGESLTEHGIYFDHHGLHEPVIRVPLMLAGGGIPSTRATGLVQHFDLVPTVLDVLGEPNDIDATGGSLLPMVRGSKPTEAKGPPYEHVFVEERHTRSARALRGERYKLVDTVDGSPECRYCETTHTALPALYDLKSDPDEQENLLDGEDEAATEQRRRLESAFGSWHTCLSDPVARDGQETIAAAELERRLEHLGYR
jgi:arylsulfatase A-like enzyme